MTSFRNSDRKPGELKRKHKRNTNASYKPTRIKDRNTEITNQQPKLLDRVSLEIRARHFSSSTEKRISHGSNSSLFFTENVTLQRWQKMKSISFYHLWR